MEGSFGRLRTAERWIEVIAGGDLVFEGEDVVVAAVGAMGGGLQLGFELVEVAARWPL